MPQEAILPAWVAPSKKTGGQDHLGVGVLSYNLYSRLLPGITNVTQRARYFSFYPWALHAYAREVSVRDKDQWRQFLRACDFLYTLVSLAHDCDQPNKAALTGAMKAGPLVREMQADPKKMFSLGPFVKFDGPEAYFKSRSGGLGQYYQTTIEKMEIFAADEDSRDVPKLHEDLGVRIAAAVDGGGPTEAFIRCATEKKVSLNELRALAERWCCCTLKSNETERRALIDIFFDSSDRYESEGRTQRQSLLACLATIDRLPKNLEVLTVDAMTWTHRETLYYGHFENGQELRSAEFLDTSLNGWRAVQAQEYFNMALYQIFLGAMELLEADPDGATRGTPFPRFKTAVHDSFSQGLREVGKQGWAVIEPKTSMKDALASIRQKAKKDSEWAGDPLSEASLSEDISEPHQRLAHSFLALCRLVLRLRDDAKFRASYRIDPGIAARYRINLKLLFEDFERLKDANVQSVFDVLLEQYVLLQHLWIAMRKLGLQDDDTFKFSLEEGMIRHIDMPRIAMSGIRLKSAFQILFDLGLYFFGKQGPRLTAQGRALLERYDANS